MTARWASGGVRVVALVAVMLALPTAAWAAAVPGATYNGTASDGATISLTVSSSGTSVSSYRVLGILGTDTNGAQCQAEAAETPAGGWPGTAITNNAFQFSVFTTFSISGSFPTAQSASGTFDLSDPAVGGGTGCSTGVISWSATTTSTPPGGGGGSAGGGGVTSTNSGQHKLVSVHVTLRRLSQRKLVGRLRASARSCVARRMVYLWKGHRRVSSRRALKNGSFSFGVRRAWRGVRVHATIRELRTTAGTCRSGSSSVIRG